MTEKLHTPTMGRIREQFIEAWAGDFVFGKVDAAKYFDRALDAHNARIEAAAEQRGAEKALLKATDAIRGNQLPSGNEHTELCDNCAIAAADHLLDRADLLEGDDE